MSSWLDFNADCMSDTDSFTSLDSHLKLAPQLSLGQYSGSYHVKFFRRHSHQGPIDRIRDRRHCAPLSL